MSNEDEVVAVTHPPVVGEEVADIAEVQPVDHSGAPDGAQVELDPEAVLPSFNLAIPLFSMAQAPKKDEKAVLNDPRDCETMEESTFEQKFSSAEAEAHTCQPFNLGYDRREVLAKLR